MVESPQIPALLPLIERRGEYVYVGCQHAVNPLVRTKSPPDEDVKDAALRALSDALCQAVLKHVGIKGGPVKDGSEHWYVFRNLSGRVCMVDGCLQTHPYLMVDHLPYADTVPVSPLTDCPAVLAEPGMQVVYRQVQDGIQVQGWRQQWVYRTLNVP